MGCDSIHSIAKIGCTLETLRTWVCQSETDQGIRDGLSTSDRERLKELERENSLFQYEMSLKGVRISSKK